MNVGDLKSIVKQGLISRGTISQFNDIELSLVGDKVNITIK